jgi:hypothetical protein
MLPDVVARRAPGTHSTLAPGCGARIWSCPWVAQRVTTLVHQPKAVPIDPRTRPDLRGPVHKPLGRHRSLTNPLTHDMKFFIQQPGRCQVHLGHRQPRLEQLGRA